MVTIIIYSINWMSYNVSDDNNKYDNGDNYNNNKDNNF